MLKTMDLDSVNEIIAILRCYQDNFAMVSGYGIAPKEFYEKAVENMNTHIQEVLELAE